MPVLFCKLFPSLGGKHQRSGWGHQRSGWGTLHTAGTLEVKVGGTRGQDEGHQRSGCGTPEVRGETSEVMVGDIRGYGGGHQRLGWGTLHSAGTPTELSIFLGAGSPCTTVDCLEELVKSRNRIRRMISRSRRIERMSRRNTGCTGFSALCRATWFLLNLLGSVHPAGTRAGISVTGSVWAMDGVFFIERNADISI